VTNEQQGSWAADPTGTHQYRWWDGTSYTDTVADGDVVSVDPMMVAGHPVVRPFSLLVYGESKIGKSHLMTTAPAPRLIADIEGQMDHLPGFDSWYKWDLVGAPPENETTYVLLQDYDKFNRLYQWLNSGFHPFSSFCIDSITELQDRCMDKIAPGRAMEQQGWGELLRTMHGAIRQLRDLRIRDNGMKTLPVLCATAQMREQNSRKIPHVQGQLAVRLPYAFDVVGYYAPVVYEGGGRARRLNIMPNAYGLYEAGSRYEDELGEFVDNPNIEQMINRIVAVRAAGGVHQ